jgi:hypothetical protein
LKCRIAGVVAVDKEAVEDAEGDRGHGEKIHSRYRLPPVDEPQPACYDGFAANLWALNSAVECHLHTLSVRSN